MFAINPAGAFDDRCGEHTRFPEHFQRDAGADNVHNGIHRPDFMEMHAARWQPVNFAFRFRNALEHGDGFFLHPRRQFASCDEIFDFSECPALVVVVGVDICQMHIEFDSFNAGLLFARDVAGDSRQV